MVSGVLGRWMELRSGGSGDVAGGAMCIRFRMCAEGPRFDDTDRAVRVGSGVIALHSDTRDATREGVLDRTACFLALELANA